MEQSKIISGNTGTINRPGFYIALLTVVLTMCSQPGHKTDPTTVFEYKETAKYRKMNFIAFRKEFIEDAEPVKSPYLAIPVIDLNEDSDRQVVVDRKKGQYLGHPTTVLLEDNKTMICVYPKGHGKGAIVMKRSNDGGLTWSDRLTTPDSWETSKEVPTIFRVFGPQGKKRLIMFSGLYPARMAVSEDDG